LDSFHALERVSVAACAESDPHHRDDREDISRSGALGAILAAETRQWLGVFDDMRNTPHDAVTAIALLEPDLFKLTPPGRVRIDTNFDRAGSSTFTPDPTGTVLIATAVDVPAVTSRILGNIFRAGAGPGHVR
jgi:purine nucleosidase